VEHEDLGQVVVEPRGVEGQRLHVGILEEAVPVEVEGQHPPFPADGERLRRPHFTTTGDPPQGPAQGGGPIG
jgi:hypothetical protein